MFPWRIQLYYTASTDYNQDYILILELWITSKTVIYRESGKIVLNPTGLSKRFTGFGTKDLVCSTGHFRYYMMLSSYTPRLVSFRGLM